MAQESLGSIILAPRSVTVGSPAGNALENINTDILADGVLCYVTEGVGRGEWQLQKEATDAPNGTTIVAPTSGSGRWFLKIKPGVADIGVLTYTVGPAGSGARFTSIQAAIDDAEANLTPVSILVMAGDYTENLLITKPGINITGFNDRALGQFHIIGNITYNLDADGEIALQQIDVDGQLIVAGTNITQLYLIAVEIHANTADGVLDHTVNDPGSSSTIIIEGNVRLVNAGSGPAYRSTNGGRFDGEECRLTASSTSNNAAVTNGDFIGRNVEMSGDLVYTGINVFGLTLVGAASSIVANGSCIDLSGTSVPVLITGIRLSSITNASVFAGATPAKLSFADIQVPVGFGTFDTTQGSRLASDGIVFKSSTAAAGADFLNENGGYSNASLLESFTVGTLPTPTAGLMIFVTDETGGAVPAFGDGTNFRRVTDSAIVL